MTRCDVLVVGAGPAGALAAREVALLGASVLLVDRSPFPRSKVCGGCLSEGALQVLGSVGLGQVPDRLGAQRLDTFVLSARGRTARLSLAGGCAVSRSSLDRALVDEARRAGVEWWPAARARLAAPASDRRVVHVSTASRHVEVRARVVLDATGLASLDADPAKVAPGSRLGLGATLHAPDYPVVPGDLHMAVGRTGYVGLVRIESGDLNVAAAVDPTCLRGSTPEQAVAEILASAGMPALTGRALVDWRGTPLLTRSPADVGGERLLRLGDAGGYVEPFTGEGMCWAMSAASAVAPLAVAAAEEWRPDVLHRWRRYQHGTLRRARRLCRVLTPLLRHPRLVSGAIAGLGLAPSAAGPLMRLAARRPELAVGTPT